MKKAVSLMIMVVLLCNSALSWGQTEPEEIKLEDNKFKEYFFEALKQKAIENYDKAIVALERCLKIDANNTTIYHELGKNYLALKDYKNAYSSFEKANTLDPKNKWFLIGMYDVDYETKDYADAIKVINKLIPFDSKFKEDLTSLYMNTGEFDKALLLINELNETVGKSERRENYKLQILSQGTYQDAEITNLVNQINKNPKEESNYISLIYLYSKKDDIEKVLETARKLEAAIPNSEWAQVSLFKNYLVNNESEKAIKAMNIVLASTKIDSKIKHRIFNEFLIYVNTNPQLTADLDKAIGYFDDDKNVNVNKEVGKYYHNKKQWDKAIKYYQLSLKKSSPADVETSLLLLDVYVQLDEFEKSAKTASEMIELYPAQVQFYYYAGLAYNQLKQFKKAKEILEMGMDYVVEDATLEINFNIQLGEAFSGLGDANKKEFYFSKANELLKKQK
ncbi:tetratricopeptide repeat protein [Flavobacterium sufflavum]|uniref:Tetratricopeptide repeat protein n=1 Tax=Flavobacterium sufflavum TaxID=1921138 RepID=A0A3S2XII0_9FLAO|nr:tetratricopeptide repeat protein [Flavobacterium sufflavum]RVT80000.1 tetratricopeptide repeat protein [Flavobacterium sufflavum]